jgi:hypothetical protein
MSHSQPQEDINTSNKRRKTNDEEETEDLNDQLRAIWKNSSDDTAFNDTLHLIGKQMDGLIRTGLDAFHRWENASRELEMLKEECKGKQVEFERLRAAEEKSRATVSVSLLFACVLRTCFETLR